MQKSASYFISGTRAYPSEIALFRKERITAERCAVLKAPAGLCELYLVEGPRGALTAWADGAKALKVMIRCNGRRLISIPVL
jgi:hypothetical protein